jgi:tRNA(fMet)-specific endonuclease VapC
MLVLDTDHLVELDRGSSQGAALQQKLEDAGDAVATTIISAEEQFRGWLAQLHRQRDPHEQIATYQRLQRRIAFFAAWHVLPWDTDAADILQGLRRQRVRISTIDLKSASANLTPASLCSPRTPRTFFRSIPCARKRVVNITRSCRVRPSTKIVTR